jgi:hypothetical protein
MGNRSKYLAVTAAATSAVLVAGRRRARLRRAAAHRGDTIRPTQLADMHTDLASGIDKIHAPGHQHRPPPDGGEQPPARLPGRPWLRHAHGMRHPYSGD